eukprot:13307997-Ditylum_brightwellii.AAC.1
MPQILLCALTSNSFSSSSLVLLDGVPYDIFCMKEPEYIMKVMSTYGSLTAYPDQKLSKRVFKNNQ